MQAKELAQPAREDLDLSRVLRALSDATRRAILTTLLAGPQPCTAFEVQVAKSTLSQHLKMLRESGLTHTRIEGRNHIASLRVDDVEARFPGLLRAAGIAQTTAGG